MKIINPSVECWENTDNIQHIAKCARVCYASDSIRDAGKMLIRLQQNGHTSMFRHGTNYYIVPKEQCPRLPHADFIGLRIAKDMMYVSANLDWCQRYSDVSSKLEQWKVSEKDFLGTPGEMLIRKTFYVTTQISTSRELNRTSPNNIAEQSTRYVDFERKGGVEIVCPYWYEKLSKFNKWKCRIIWSICGYAYRKFTDLGLGVQDVREFLPLSTATKVVYTYTLREWGHIINLRYWGTTGKPHPNAVEIAGEIKDILSKEFPIFAKPIAE